eukprot:TRINITY_DN7571_c2_g1_i2.p2 TRINITY_DN7571_c2_g1~~TRINITY_DN7571_c2_g1_i2.p2  ORF type:complete len:405 (+),score=140.18 TRINITY_DN7571_c2_g1_i2:1194-2408(+)
MGFPQCFGTVAVRSGEAARDQHSDGSPRTTFEPSWDVVAAITGTQSSADVWADMDAAMVPHLPSGGRVHRGMLGYFLTAWAGAPWRGLVGLEVSLARCVREHRQRYGRAPRVLVTGHSLGGATAQLAAGQIAARRRETEPHGGVWAGVELDLVTFGTPHVGDAAFAAWMRCAAARSVHVAQAADPVPHTVPNPAPPGKLPPLASGTAGAANMWHGGDAYVLALYHHRRHTAAARGRRSDAAILRDFCFAAALTLVWKVPLGLLAAARCCAFGCGGGEEAEGAPAPASAAGAPAPVAYGSLAPVKGMSDLLAAAGSEVPATDSGSQLPAPSEAGRAPSAAAGDWWRTALPAALPGSGPPLLSASAAAEHRRRHSTAAAADGDAARRVAFSAASVPSVLPHSSLED